MVKIVIDNKSFMMLGDIYTKGSNVLVAMHSKDYLKSDVVQVAHHGYNNNATLYARIAAEVALFPNAMSNAKKNVATYASVMRYAKEEYYAHKWIYRFTVENGALKVTEIPRYDQKQ